MSALPTQDNDVFWRKIKHLSRGTGQALVVMAVMSGGGHPLGVSAPGQSPARTPYAVHAEQVVTLAPYFNPGGPYLALLPSASEELPEEYLQLIASFNSWQQKLYPSQPPDALDDPELVAHLYQLSGGHVSLLHRMGQHAQQGTPVESNTGLCAEGYRRALVGIELTPDTSGHQVAHMSHSHFTHALNHCTSTTPPCTVAM
jgi:hypothetical protein